MWNPQILQQQAPPVWYPRTIIFPDHPEFAPNITPLEIFLQGGFEGAYFRPIHSSVTSLDYKDWWMEFPDFVAAVQANPTLINHFASPNPSSKINKYQVEAGSDLHEWESKGWIMAQDPYGWVQWYCRFYYGRRSPDDARQIQRWLNFAGPSGRFKKTLINKIKKANTAYDDVKISPKIRQGLHHWGYCLMPYDLQ